jgi:hypothetical protein
MITGLDFIAAIGGPTQILATYKLSKQYDMGTNQSASLPDKTTGLTFNEAMKAMHSGWKVRLPEWTGYWFMNNGEMSLLTRTGDILTTPDFKKFGSRDDWEIAIQGMGFDFAMLALKAGKLLARAAWRDQLIFIRPAHTMTLAYALSTDKSLPGSLRSWLTEKISNKGEATVDQVYSENPINFESYICKIDSKLNVFNGWRPTQQDMMATDWEVIQVPEWQSNEHPGLSGNSSTISNYPNE